MTSLPAYVLIAIPVAMLLGVGALETAYENRPMPNAAYAAQTFLGQAFWFFLIGLGVSWCLHQIW